jgi:hypothetical protein
MNMIVISSGHDNGEYELEMMSKAELLKRLNDDYYDLPILNDKIRHNRKFDLTSQAGMFILEGAFLTPIPKEVVKEWTLPE